MATLGADSRLRARVSKMEGTVILIGAGHVDRVVRFTNLPDCLKPFMSMEYKREGDNQTMERVYPVLLNLDRGPDGEAWALALKDAHVKARRDKPMPEPLPVSAATSEGWSLDEEDIPVIEYDGKEATRPTTGHRCETCTVEFNTENGLRIHRARTKHE